MSDEAGEKMRRSLQSRMSKLTTLYHHVKEPEDLGQLLLDQIGHFFENYKDLEAGKWVKVDGWRGSDAARDAVIAAVEAAKK
jgi:Inorganic pyrophosphatase